MRGKAPRFFDHEVVSGGAACCLGETAHWDLGGVSSTVLIAEAAERRLELIINGEPTGMIHPYAARDQRRVRYFG